MMLRRALNARPSSNPRPPSHRSRSSCSPTIAQPAAVARDEGASALGKSDLREQLFRKRPSTWPAVAEESSEIAHVFLAGLPGGIARALGENADQPANLRRTSVRGPGDAEA